MSQHEVDPRWAQLAGPTPKSEVQWRIVGQPKMFGDSYRAMFRWRTSIRATCRRGWMLFFPANGR